MQIIPYPYKLATRYRGAEKNQVSSIIDNINTVISSQSYGFNDPDSSQTAHIGFTGDEFKILMTPILVSKGTELDFLLDEMEPMIKFIADIYIKEGYGFEYILNTDGISVMINITI